MLAPIYKYFSVIALSLLLGGIFVPRTAAQPEPVQPIGIETLVEYFDMLASGNYESASYYWTESALERSSRFGITYEGIPVKVDATSPIVRNLDFMRDHLQRPVKQMDRMIDTNYTRMIYSTVARGNLVEHTYWAVKAGDYYWLCYPQDYYARDWDVVESEYLRVHVHPDVRQYINPVVLENADKHIEMLAAKMTLDDESMNGLREKKIEYFYCDTDGTVQSITGHLTKGTTDLASNDIISAFFPHYHEITHLIMNIKLRELPLYTLPIMREGVAVHFGGRWGKAPTALAGLGGFLYKEKFVELDSILTMAEFDRNAQADIAYPVAGLFTGFLIDRLGWDDYLELYGELSGPFDTLYVMPKTVIQQSFVTATETDSWPSLVDEFSEYVKAYLENESVMIPGSTDDGEQLLSDDNMIVRENGDWLAFEFSGDGEPAGNLLFGHNEELNGTNSLSFDDQYDGNQAFSGYRFGVRFDTNEAGLYDYVSNELVAKYIWGITPSDEYFDKETQRVSFMVKKALVGEARPVKGDHRFLSN